MGKRDKRTIKVGDKVVFNTGNYQGLTGEVIKIDWLSDHPDAIYGIWHEVNLSNGKIGIIEKSEHWEFIKETLRS